MSAHANLDEAASRMGAGKLFVIAPRRQRLPGGPDRDWTMRHPVVSFIA
jgi:hypothetical protein